MEASPSDSLAERPVAVALGGSEVWLVLPTYNEALNLQPFVEAARNQLPAGSRILVVDDNSPDGTGAVADRLASESGDMEVLHRLRKEGLGPAYVAGFRQALESGARIVLQMDADFSHDPADIPRLLEGAKVADVVLGSRYVTGGGVSGWGPVRRILSRAGSAYARGILGLPIRDLTSGFKAFRRDALEAVDYASIAAAGYSFQVEMTYRAARAGFRIEEVPIHFRDRRLGISKMTPRIALEAAVEVPRMRRSG